MSMKAPTLRELRQTAKALGIHGYSKLRKGELARAIGKAPEPAAPAIIAPPAPPPRCEVIGGAALWLADCRDVLPNMGKVAHVITDPPYEASLHKAKNSMREKHPFRRMRHDGGTEFKRLEFAPIDDIRADVVRLVQDCCEGWFIAFCTVEGTAKWADTINASRVRYKRACIWIKPDAPPQLNGQGPGQGAEMFVSAWAGRGHASWNAGGKRGIYTHCIRQKDRDGRHPTEKPVSLMREILGDFTKPGELVCDPFMGSGTTGVAALALGRCFVGIEQDPRWFDVACRRIDKAARQTDLFIPATPLRPKERRAMAPELALPMPPPLVPMSAAIPIHHKADGGEQTDLEDFLRGDKRSE